MRKLFVLFLAATIIFFGGRISAAPKPAVDAHFLQAIYADYNERELYT